VLFAGISTCYVRPGISNVTDAIQPSYRGIIVCRYMKELQSIDLADMMLWIPIVSVHVNLWE
jgi:hypothetical protein